MTTLPVATGAKATAESKGPASALAFAPGVINVPFPQEIALP